MFGNRKFYALFFRKKQGAFEKWKKKRLWTLPSEGKSFGFKKKSFSGDFEHFTFEKGLKTFFAFDYDSRNQLFFESTMNGANLDDLADLTLRQGIIRQWTSNLAGNKQGLFMMILLLLLGITGTFTVLYFMG